MGYPASNRRDEYPELPLPAREIDVLRRALELVRDRLPSGWKLQVDEEVSLGGRRADALVVLRGPDGAEAKLAVEAKRLLTPRDVPAALDQLAFFQDAAGPITPMIVGRYLTPSTRQELEARGSAYADATGNLRLALDRPALFLRDVGADRDPWRAPGRPRGTLKGPAAARVARALLDFRPPYSIPELRKLSGASSGATYRVIEFLEQEGIVERAPRGPITDVDWRRLLMRWSEDYGFQRSNSVSAFLEPRGLAALVDRLRDRQDIQYTVTGSLAAERIAPYAPARLAMIYVDKAEQVAQDLGLRQVDSGANVLLATGDYDVVFDRAVLGEGTKWAATSQVAVDLLTGPGRNPAEAESLMDWMAANELQWRRQLIF
jgi:hypothetical protein